jgi:hypothetical protein
MIEDLQISDSGGLVIVYERFDQFTKIPDSCKLATFDGVAHVLLDICARASRNHMLTGKRLLILVQSNDPRIEFEGLGAVGARWNCHEFLNEHRGL